MKIRANAWSRLGENAAFGGVGLMEAVKDREDIRFITADVSTLLGLGRFKAMYPDYYYDVGIAEQNLVTVASGMAIEGKCVFISTYASFLAVRGLEQIRHNLGYLKCNVKAVGMSSGLSVGKSGVAHWCTEDIAFMRAIPNMTVLSPADCTEVVKMTLAAAEMNGPVYMRLTGNLNVPVIYKEDYDLRIGKAITLREGEDVAIIATGLLVKDSLDAAEQLEEKGISCSVYNMHTIKPLDTELLEKIYKKYKLIVTVEEHNVVGGLGGAVAEHKAGFCGAPRQVFMGITDEYKKTGSRPFILGQYQLNTEGIVNRICNEINN